MRKRCANLQLAIPRIDWPGGIGHSPETMERPCSCSEFAQWNNLSFDQGPWEPLHSLRSLLDRAKNQVAAGYPRQLGSGNHARIKPMVGTVPLLQQPLGRCGEVFFSNWILGGDPCDPLTGTLLHFNFETIKQLWTHKSSVRSLSAPAPF